MSCRKDFGLIHRFTINSNNKFQFSYLSAKFLKRQWEVRTVATVVEKVALIVLVVVEVVEVVVVVVVVVVIVVVVVVVVVD